MKRQNIYKQIALSLLLLVGMAGTAWGQGYDYIEDITPVTVDDGSDIYNAFDENDATWWEAEKPGTRTITLSYNKDVHVHSIYIKGGGSGETPTEQNMRPVKIEVKYLNKNKYYGRDKTSYIKLRD